MCSVFRVNLNLKTEGKRGACQQFVLVRCGMVPGDADDG
jgi:hypothetical protein